jgi:hypothetical protein
VLGEQPGQSDLPGRDALARGDGLDLVDQREVVLEGVTGEPGDLGAQVVGGERGRGVDGAGEEALAERAEGDEADAELGARRAVMAVTGLIPLLALAATGATSRYAGRQPAPTGQSPTIEPAPYPTDRSALPSAPG